ncbi:MAG: hypothetical protein QW797_00995 [Thermoproteota archaeon]
MSSQLDKKHERFIFSAALALQKYVKDLKKIVLEGEPPEASGIAGRPAPLPSEEAEKLIVRLSEVEKIVDEFIERFNPGIRNEPSLSLSYIWISIILGKMEGIVESIDPRSLGKTRGEMPRELEKYLDRQVKTLLSLVRELRQTYTTATNMKTQLPME